MKRILLVVTAVGFALLLIVLVGACSAGTQPTSSTATSNQTPMASDQASTSTAQSTASSSDQGTDTTAQNTSTTSSESTTTTTPSATSNTSTIGHQQTDSRLSYSGTWKTVSDSSASGGSFAFADSSGASVTIRFIGTHLAWIAKKSPAYGEAKVTVDGGTAKIVNLYSFKALYKQTVWETGTLKEDAHTVVISWTGKKTFAATGANIDVDAIQVTGVLTGRVQQSNSRLLYAGTWKTVSSNSALGGSFAYADSAGASVTIHFTGIDVAWFAKKGPNYGEAEITVDGAKTYTVSLYSSSEIWQKRLWSTGILPMGSHTVTIKWLGTKSKSATGTNIDVDAFDVTGTLQ